MSNLLSGLIERLLLRSLWQVLRLVELQLLRGKVKCGPPFISACLLALADSDVVPIRAWIIGGKARQDHASANGLGGFFSSETAGIKDDSGKYSRSLKITPLQNRLSLVIENAPAILIAERVLLMPFPILNDAALLALA